MAATRLIAIHENKGRTVAQSLKLRTDYAKNGEKTEDGKYISAYECHPDLIDLEFANSKREYFDYTGRVYPGDIIAYQIRQSFKPGEITPEEANAVGYETAMRFTKGEHAFIVATHTDRAHIHNHIIFNSTNLTCDRKFRDSWFVALALQKVSDLVCLEHALSVIKPRKPGERDKRTTYPPRETIRDKVRSDIDAVLQCEPSDYEEFLQRMRARGYEIKPGKFTAIRGSGQKRFLRFRSFGESYSEDAIRNKIQENCSRASTSKGRKREFDLLIDINRKLSEGKGKGYANWAARYNVKQVAAALLFLQEHDIRDYAALENITAKQTEQFHQLSEDLKTKEKRLADIAALKKNIVNYSKTREVYVAYRKSGYSKKFLEEHREDITLHKAAKQMFDELGLKKLPKIKNLSDEYAGVLEEKRKVYSRYKETKASMMEYQIAKRNIDQILRLDQEKENDRRIEKEKNHNSAR